ncbi:MAG: NAD(P)/FAD-dependent oxidoreductase [Rhodothermales bacterium]
MRTTEADLVVVGAGAAGLMCAIQAARTRPDARVVLVDGARKLGAKILVAGGGRCNVTHHAVSADDYAGSSRNAIRKVLRQFDVADTVTFFEALGVTLKREETGKLFPVTDRAQSVLDALLHAARDAGVRILNPWRVKSVMRRPVLESALEPALESVLEPAHGARFQVVSADGERLSARSIVLATGGLSLPKSGSDGSGYGFARHLGHTITDPVLPALVPLNLEAGHFLTKLSGITLDAAFDVLSSSGKRLVRMGGSTLLTHFGLSGPAVLDVSRHYLMAQHDEPGAVLTVNWLPSESPESFEARLVSEASTLQLAHTLLKRQLPDRLAAALIDQVETNGPELSRAARRSLVDLTTRYALPIIGNRGFKYAEVTAGGVPLAELNLKTMESRLCPGLYIVGELCDVDGRIGGFNFQWAWASGHVCGSVAALPPDASRVTPDA